MIRAILVRTDSTPHETCGILYIENKKFFTLELPYKDNHPVTSCIPLGQYDCTFVFSPKFNKKTYLLSQVKDRSAIRIHSGNTTDDIQGCILLGRERGILNGHAAVLKSKNAIEEFQDILNGQPFVLEIIEGNNDEKVFIA